MIHILLLLGCLISHQHINKELYKKIYEYFNDQLYEGEIPLNDLAISYYKCLQNNLFQRYKFYYIKYGIYPEHSQEKDLFAINDKNEILPLSTFKTRENLDIMIKNINLMIKEEKLKNIDRKKFIRFILMIMKPYANLYIIKIKEKVSNDDVRMFVKAIEYSFEFTLKFIVHNNYTIEIKNKKTAKKWLNYVVPSIRKHYPK